MYWWATQTNPTCHEPNLRQKSWDLQRLYGRDTLPDELLQLFNRGLGVWVHVSKKVGEEHSCLQEAFRLLSHLVLSCRRDRNRRGFDTLRHVLEHSSACG